MPDDPCPWVDEPGDARSGRGQGAGASEAVHHPPSQVEGPRHDVLRPATGRRCGGGDDRARRRRSARLRSWSRRCPSRASCPDLLIEQPRRQRTRNGRRTAPGDDVDLSARPPAVDEDHELAGDAELSCPDPRRMLRHRCRGPRPPRGGSCDGSLVGREADRGRPPRHPADGVVGFGLDLDDRGGAVAGAPCSGGVGDPEGARNRDLRLARSGRRRDCCSRAGEPAA